MSQIIIENLEKILREQNLRLLFKSSEPIENNKILILEEENLKIFNKAFNFDRLIVISTPNNNGEKYQLFRIENLSMQSNEVKLNLITDVNFLEKKIHESIEFVQFEILLPLVILKDTFIVPFESTNLIIGRRFSIDSVLKAYQDSLNVIAVKQIHFDVENPKFIDLISYGTICEVKDITKNDPSLMKSTLIGKYRINLTEMVEIDGVFFGKANIFYETYNMQSIGLYQKNYLVKLNSFKQKSGSSDIPLELVDILINSIDPWFFAFTIVSLAILEKNKRNSIMKFSIEEIMEEILKDITEKLYYFELDQKINEDTKVLITEKNKQIWLKEKIEALKKQISDANYLEDSDMASKAGENKDSYPEHVKNALSEELSKLKNLHHSSAEYNSVKQYISWIYSLPWYSTKTPNKDIKEIRKILDEKHIGSPRLKDLLILYMVDFLNESKIGGNVILLVGPPGVGKTCIAKAIAEALKLPSYDISLAGMSDSSILLGFARTYVASEPGALAKGLKATKTLNPIFILDEVDKINQQSGKNPMEAFLRALDSEHNYSTKDNYLDPALDLSKVNWILTANDLRSLPAAFLDRCYIIELSGYCLEEKILVANKIIDRLNKKKDKIKLSPKSIVYLINSYTHETGARELYKTLETVLKWAALEMNCKNLKSIDISRSDIDKALIARHKVRLVELDSEPGVVKGLAYTGRGGDLLYIYCKKVKKTDEKEISSFTGNIKDVMKESLKVVFSFVKIYAEKLDIDLNVFKEYAFHFHTSDAAVPKDGPSAGITMCTALISLLKNKKLKDNIAMTGELALNGQVMPIGGLVEKINAISRFMEHKSITEKFQVFIPESNLIDIEKNIHPSVLKKVSIIPVHNIFQVLDKVFEEEST